jgi:hypothetical protein
MEGVDETRQTKRNADKTRAGTLHSAIAREIPTIERYHRVTVKLQAEHANGRIQALPSKPTRPTREDCSVRAWAARLNIAMGLKRMQTDPETELFRNRLQRAKGRTKRIYPSGISHPEMDVT